MATPVQRQYWELKKQNPDAILWFRLGDFYEMFFADAELSARVLSIQLTARGRGTENEMPMCGFPYHSSDDYLEKLVNAGYKVAIAEQFEDPETGVISRRVDRVVTPGTTLQDGNLNPEQNNYLVAIDLQRSKSKSKKNIWAIASSDASTGEFRTVHFSDRIPFLDELYKINPAEILIPSHLFADEEFCAKLPKKSLQTVRSDLSEKKSKDILEKFFPNLAIFGIEKITVLLNVCATVMEYLEETQNSKVEQISKIIKYSTDEFMNLDAQTFQHLEIFESIQNTDRSATFMSVFKRASTAMGARKLREFIARPLLSAEKITERQDVVGDFLQKLETKQDITRLLKNITDLERILTRIAIGRGTGRDAAMIRDSLIVFPEIAAILQSSEVPFLQKKVDDLNQFTELLNLLNSSLIENPPLEITAGGIFQTGYSTELDELREITKNSQAWLDDFVAKKTEETGLKNLRIKYSKNFGFCLEISRIHSDKVPESWTRRQTLTNAERFTTEELVEFEEKFLSAESRSFELEHQMFLKLRGEIIKFGTKIQRAAVVIAEIDTLHTLARTAQSLRWTRPIIKQDDNYFHVKKVRHPVVEQISTETFIDNDLSMNNDDSRIHLITGPNMAGKSTFLRQNALVILLGQIGSFVPASEAKWGVFDRIFTRVGASDNLAGGQSTFFVEMAETASILNSATERSFVILDEIGRGTSTFDGISLAWAITEFLHDKIKAKVLFATHYHELIDLADDLSAAHNFHVSATQNKQGIVFLRKVLPGGIADSFGIEVAKVAGIPSCVISKSREILKQLESENLLSGKPTLFSFVPKNEAYEEGVKAQSELEKFVEEIDPDDLSPREALNLIYKLKKIPKM